MENDKWYLEMDRGGASIYIMSNLVTFIVPREEGTKHDYSFYKNVSIEQAALLMDMVFIIQSILTQFLLMGPL